MLTPSVISALGKKMAAVGSLLQQAADSLNGAAIGGDAFSEDGIVLANVYPGALDFGRRDIANKRTQLQQMSSGLVATAATWEEAEQASTVQVTS